MGASQSREEIENEIKQIDEKIIELTTRKGVLKKKIEKLSPKTELPAAQLSATDVEQVESGEKIGGKKRRKKTKKHRKKNKRKTGKK